MPPQQSQRRQQLIEEARSLSSGGEAPQEGTARAPQIGEAFAEGFVPNQPFQNPIEVLRQLRDAGLGNIAKGLVGAQGETLSSGIEAITDPSDPGAVGRFVPPPFNNPRALNVALAAVPLLGPMISNAVVEPAAQALESPTLGGAAEPAARGAGGMAGLGLSAVVDRGLGGVARRATQAAKQTTAAQKLGDLATAGTREGAGGITRFTESIVSRFPGGRGVIDSARNAAQRALVDNGINRVVGTIANFRGSRLDLLNRVGRQVDSVIDGLEEGNRAMYQAFDQQLNTPLGLRMPQSRGQQLRGAPGGGEVTALVPQSQAGATVRAAAPSGTRVTSFMGDTVSNIADRLLANLRQESRVVADPAMDALVRKVEGLSQLRGQAITVETAASARSTLLKLARRMDNPLGSKEQRLMAQIFDPVDDAIERTLRTHGGDELVTQWREANRGVRKLHELVDDTLFEKVIQRGSPEEISVAFNNASASDLARMRSSLTASGGREQWDRVRALLIRDRMAKAVRGESAVVARGGASESGPGQPLAVNLGESSTPRVGRDAIIEQLNNIPEEIRGILLNDKEIASFERLNAVANRVGGIDEAIGKLIGSGIAAGTLIAVPGAAAGAMLGAGAGAGALAAAAGGAAALTLGSKGVAWMLTRPELMDMARGALAQGTRGVIDAGVVGRQILNQMPPEVLQEFIGTNGIPPNRLPADVRARAFGGGNPLMNAFRMPGGSQEPPQ